MRAGLNLVRLVNGVLKIVQDTSKIGSLEADHQPQP